MKQYETLSHWRRYENQELGISGEVIPNPDTALGYSMRLTNAQGKSGLVHTFAKNALIPSKEQSQFQKNGLATIPITLLARAVDVVYEVMLDDCKLMAGEMSGNMLLLAQTLFPCEGVSKVGILRIPLSHFEQLVSTILTAFLSIIAMKVHPIDLVHRETWNLVIEAENMFYSLAESQNLF